MLRAANKVRKVKKGVDTLRRAQLARQVATMQEDVLSIDDIEEVREEVPRVQNTFYFHTNNFNVSNLVRFYSAAINQTMNYSSESSSVPVVLDFKTIVLVASLEAEEEPQYYIPRHIAIEYGEDEGVSGYPNRSETNRDRTRRPRRGGKTMINMVKPGVNLSVPETRKIFFDHKSIKVVKLQISLWDVNYFLENMRSVYREEFEYRLFRYEHRGVWLQEENGLHRVLRVFQRMSRSFGEEGQTLVCDPLTKEIRLRRRDEEDVEGIQASPYECFEWIKMKIRDLSLPVIVDHRPTSLIPYKETKFTL